MKVEYELDQWEWQGTTRSIDIDPEDYRDMDTVAIKQAVYDEIWRDAEQNLHFVYAEDDVVREIQESATEDEEGD